MSQHEDKDQKEKKEDQETQAAGKKVSMVQEERGVVIVREFFESAEQQAEENFGVADLVAMIRNEGKNVDEQESAMDVAHAEALSYNELRNEVLETIKDNPYIYRYGKGFLDKFDQWKDLLSDDKELLMQAAKNDYGRLGLVVMELASERLRGDEHFVRNMLLDAAYTEAPQVLSLASEEVRDDERVIKIAIQENPYAIEFSSDRLKNAPETVGFAVGEENKMHWSQQCDELRKKRKLETNNKYYILSDDEYEELRKSPMPSDILASVQESDEEGPVFIGDELKAKIRKTLGRVGSSGAPKQEAAAA